MTVETEQYNYNSCTYSSLGAGNNAKPPTDEMKKHSSSMFPVIDFQRSNIHQPLENIESPVSSAVLDEKQRKNNNS